MGKTFLIREFFLKHFENCFEINLLERKDVVQALSMVNNSKDLLLVLSSFSDVPFVPGKTVIFIDVIDEARKAFFECRQVLEPIHNKLLDYYKYLIIGGMPESVNVFIEINDLKRVSNVQTMINSICKKRC